MTFGNLTIAKTHEEVEAQSGWTTQVFIEIDRAPNEGIGMSGEIGGQPIEAFGVTFSLTPQLSGYLKTPPEVGDEFVIKIGKTVIPTGLKVEDPGIA
ncbi:MAG: hypothetical protein IT169_17140 [Bryobacterales bacterium]|nr:hypothetical protein [Bryobacterales bacterium]